MGLGRPTTCKLICQTIVGACLLLDALILCAASLSDASLLPVNLDNVTISIGWNHTIVPKHTGIVAASFIVWPQLLVMGLVASIWTCRDCIRAKRLYNAEISVPLTLDTRNPPTGIRAGDDDF